MWNNTYSQYIGSHALSALYFHKGTYVCTLEIGKKLETLSLQTLQWSAAAHSFLLLQLMISEPGRQAFWFIIIILSVLSCQAGLVLSFLGGTLRPVLENHDVMLSHYGKLQATLNVGKTGRCIFIHKSKRRRYACDCCLNSIIKDNVTYSTQTSTFEA